MGYGLYCVQWTACPQWFTADTAPRTVLRVLTIGLVNLKPGTAKTTSAVWLAHALHERGLSVGLVDSDRAASALRWSDIAGGFPFRVIGLPVRDVHRRLADIAEGLDVTVIDAPQMEDHGDIARSVMRAADELVVPVAPSGIELDRMAPVRKEIIDMEAVRPDGARWCVLLNRVVTGASSGRIARDALLSQGDQVLKTVIPRHELYPNSFGAPVEARGSAYAVVVDELLARVRVTV